MGHAREDRGMKERSILFSVPMVRANIEDRKTVTRRVVKNPEYFGCLTGDCPHGRQQECDQAVAADCPYGQPSDRLWVREAWRVPISLDGLSGKQIADKCLDAGYAKPWCPIQYEADGARNSDKDWREFGSHPSTSVPGRYRHARFMPRWASRITLEVTSVRVERLQDITPDQIIAEGVQIPATPEGRALIDISTKHGPAHFLTKLKGNTTDELLHAHWAALWVSINGIDSWNASPWVWVVEFKRVEAQTA
jgi:hypothetical protein